MNGSQEFETGSSSAARVTETASGGSPRSVSRFSSRSTSPSSTAAATRSMPKPAIPSIRAARFIVNSSTG